MKFLCFFIFVIYFVQSSLSQKTLVEKCNEYSRVKTSANNKSPHLVWIRNATPNVIHIGCIGVLVSDRYVLTTASCTNDMIVTSSQVYFNKDEQHQLEQKIVHDYWSGDSVYYNLALLKLKTPLSLDENHRPACIWTNTNLNETIANIVTWDSGVWENDFPQIEYQILSDSRCSGFHPNINNSHTCVEPVDKEKYAKLNPTNGSPLQIKYTDNYHIMGLYSYHFSNTDPRVLVYTRLTHYIKWFERYIWGIEDSEQLLYGNCGSIQVRGKPLQSFSSPTYHGQFPWHVAINKRSISRRKEYICGGSIISNSAIITAAHCVVDGNGVVSPALLSVELGKFELDISTIDTREIRVYEVIPHNEYNKDYLENDIAVLKLENLISFSYYIQPVCITRHTDIFPTTIGIVPGWGLDENQNPSNILTQASFPIHTVDDCRRSNRAFFTQFLSENNFCAGYQNGTNVCSGDSGGGMIMEAYGKWFLRGIVSLGVSLPNEQRCDITELVLFTDVVKFYDWLGQKIK